MSKLFKKVSGITLGLALCFGFSFSCSNKSSGQMTRAASVPVSLDFKTAGLSSFASESIKDGLKYTYVKGSGSSNPTFTKAKSESQYSLKIYANNYLTIEIVDNAYASFKTITTTATSKDGSTSGQGDFYVNSKSDDNLVGSHSLKTATFTSSDTFDVDGAEKVVIYCKSGQYRIGSFTYEMNESSGSTYESFNVTAHYNDGVTEDLVIPSATNTGKIAKPNDPTRDGFNFVGWYSDEELENAFDFNTIITADCDIYAKWFSYPSYCVTVHYNDGESSDDEIYSSTTTGKVSNPGDPVRSGYTFLGWYADSEFNTEFDFDTILENDGDIYAKWSSDADVANVVVNLINSIGDVSYLKKEQIVEARNAYNALTDAQKTYINNINVLQNAEAFLSTYMQFDNNLSNDGTTDLTDVLPNTWSFPNGIEFVGKGKCYNGAHSTLKIGSGSAAGSFEIKLSSSLVDAGYKISSLSIVAKAYSNDGGHISVSGTDTQLELGANYIEQVFNVKNSKATSVTVSSSPKRAYVYGIKVAYEMESATLNETLTIEGSLNKNTYYDTDYLDISGLTLYAHYSDNSQVDVTADVELENNGVLSLGQTSVLATYSTGAESATVYITGFNVIEYQSVNFGKIGRNIGENETYEGEYYLAYVDSENNAKVWNCNLSDLNNSYVSATVVNNVIASTKPLEDCVVRIAAMRNDNEEIIGYSLQVPSGKYVRGSGSGKTPVEADNPARFTISIRNNGTALIVSTFKDDPKNLGFNFSDNRIRYYNTESASVSYLTLFKKGATAVESNYEVFDSFVSQYMHFNDVEVDNNEDTGECRGENGYYRQAIGAFNYLTYDQRSLIMDTKYSDVFNRLYAWAVANGEDLNMDTCQFERLKKVPTNSVGDILTAEDDNTFVVLLGVFSLGVSALSAFYLVKKRKRAQ